MCLLDESDIRETYLLLYHVESTFNIVVLQICSGCRNPERPPMPCLYLYRDSLVYTPGNQIRLLPNDVFSISNWVGLHGGMLDIQNSYNPY